MQVDFTSLLPSVIVALVAWLIRNQFKAWDTKLDRLVTEVAGVRENHGNRLTAVETVVQTVAEGWHPYRRESDSPEYKE